MFPKRQPKKGHLPTGEVFALGSKRQGGDADIKPPSSSSSSALASRKTLGSSSTSGQLPAKREPPSAPGASLLKKPRLHHQTFTPLGRGEAERRGSPTTQVYLYDELAKEVNSPENLLVAIEDACTKEDEDLIEALLCGGVKYLKVNRAKPDPTSFLTLMHLSKSRPSIFNTEVLIEAFCSLLKREVAMNFKAKGNALVSVLVCNVLASAFIDEENWPDNFIKVYLDDSLGDRVWVDRPDCRLFVENIQSAFNTKMPKLSMLSSDAGFKESSGGSPNPTTPMDDDDSLSAMPGALKSIIDVEMDSLIYPRYIYQQVSIETTVLDTLREHLSRRTDIGSRNLLRFMTAACGYPEVRSLAVQRLEMWLQNPKLTRAAQDLLMSVCMNCDQNSSQDVDVMSQISKIRMKTKNLINHYMLCIKELLTQHPENLRTLMTHTVINELSNSRNPNNLTLITVMFQFESDQSAKLLAEVFQDLLSHKEDYLRAVRSLFREICRVARQDINFTEFCLGLMQERTEKKFKDLDPTLKERMFLGIADLISLTILLCVTPGVREAASALVRGDHKDLEVLRAFQLQTAVIQRDAVWWLHTLVPTMYDPKAHDYCSCLRKVLFVEKADAYYKLDNWPSENDRGLLFRLVSEVPVQEDTLMRLLVMGLTRELHLAAVDALDMADRLVRRAALLHTEDFSVLQIERLELIDALLNLCAYRYPENISLPKGYQAPSLAISKLYWKAWSLLLIITAFNPQTFGMTAWENYPTLKCLMEMTMTNTFRFPPPTMASDDMQLEEIRQREKQTAEVEKQRILEFEVHLAAASSKQQITEANSLLLPQLTSMDPNGIGRKPPANVLEQLKTMHQTLKIGQLLCSSREPDFLLNIIQRQGASQSMPWLAELVEANDSSLDVLPVQCLCEFLLHGDPEATDVEEEDDRSGKRKKKKSKQDQLLCRLQHLLHSPTSETRAISEVLSYFFSRLSSQHSSTRQQAVKGLSMVLSQSHMEGVAMETEYYESPQACQIETDAASVCAYIVFLAEHTKTQTLQQLDELSFDMAQLIVERATLLNHMLPQEGIAQSPWLQDRAELVLTSMIGLFHHYLKMSQQTNENISWSSAQDQILLQWESGETATLNILVVQAIIILLTYGKPKRESAFLPLLEAWFPENGNMPSGFLVNTSEEALLLPDWLKLRMIRCHTGRLVDAALLDLDPSQLLLFVQSFGIPVPSMCKLLVCLDHAMAVDPTAMSQAVVDKAYMAQLVEVQHMRGATGGHVFHQMLLAACEPETEKMDVDLRPVLRKRALSQLMRSAEITDFSNMKEILKKIFDVIKISHPEKQSLYQALNKTMIKTDISQEILEALSQLLADSTSAVISGMKKYLHFSCPLLRSVISKKKSSPLLLMVMQELNRNLQDSHSALSNMVKTYLKSENKSATISPSTGTEDFATNTKQSLISRNANTELQMRVDLAKSISSRSTNEVVASLCGLLLDQSLPNSAHGLILDWLELLDPEVLSLSPEIQGKIVFQQRSITKKATCSHEPYMLAVLTHRCNWRSIHNALHVLLRSTANHSPSDVLDFLWALHHTPSIWQGSDRKPSKNHVPEDVLRLTASEIQAVVSYIIAEMRLDKDTDKVSPHRAQLLHRCCHRQKSLVEAAVNYLTAEIKAKRDAPKCHNLIMELYLEHRDVLNFVADGNFVMSLCSQDQFSQLDAVTNRMIITLATADRGKVAENKMYDANLACRKFATNHPVLMLRQLPMMAAQLQGRSQFAFHEMRQNNHLLLFTHVLGVMELLQPIIFQPAHHPALSEAFKAFFFLFKLHGTVRMVAPIVTKFLKFLHNFALADNQGASQIIRPYTTLLNDLTSTFPDLSPLRGLLAILSLPTHEEDNVQVGRVMTPVRPSSPNMASQFAPFRARLCSNSTEAVLEVLKEIDETSKRKVDILQHFVNDLQHLFLHLDDGCRSSAHALIMRYIRHNPSYATELRPVILQSLSSDNEAIILSALRNLPEYVVLAHDHAVELLMKAFSIGIQSKVDPGAFITDAIQQLNLENMTW
ncbi:hypothetical protein CAPTEDRAFT_224526 [Capitella teleta]|uniref:Uncharacterized protein n=1 Tax=Capitella teleta TaxID=283909 RepID=R7TTG8_CAPTE|nr:hypothetical protein CAPTEDRAFT_224526 [Capitella teleta]|eukprot:ELT96897.1 hypothetical protein CAPTEDRAFT_224526 [Capitella teleta]